MKAERELLRAATELLGVVPDNAARQFEPAVKALKQALLGFDAGTVTEANVQAAAVDLRKAMVVAAFTPPISEDALDEIKEALDEIARLPSNLSFRIRSRIPEW